MVKLPSYHIGPEISSHRFNIDDCEPTIEPAIRQAINKQINGTHSMATRSTRRLGVKRTRGICVSRSAVAGGWQYRRSNAVSLTEMRAQVNVVNPRAELVTLYGHNLRSSSYSSRHGCVIRKHRAARSIVFFCSLVDTLSAAPKYSVSHD
ncbi:hypothetical protein [Rhizobium ruizarguesonis]